jgi:hypothetical protein
VNENSKMKTISVNCMNPEMTEEEIAERVQKQGGHLSHSDQEKLAAWFRKLEKKQLETEQDESEDESCQMPTK